MWQLTRRSWLRATGLASLAGSIVGGVRLAGQGSQANGVARHPAHGSHVMGTVGRVAPDRFNPTSYLKAWNFNDLAPEERARAGLFLGFQYPVEIPGVNNVYLLKAAVNAKLKAAGKPEVDAYEFLQLVRARMKLMQMDESFLSRGVNEGFSGGEKKRNEILQMLVLEPALAVLDETDSGLDIDALKVVARGVNTLKAADRGILLITHDQRLLDHIVPDFVHVLARGRIARSGGKDLALELEKRGYDWVLEVA